MPLPASISEPAQNDAVARGNRLRILKQTPGYIDLFKISEAIVANATKVLMDFQGWDNEQIARLRTYAKATHDFHALLFGTVNETLREARQEADLIAEEEAIRRSSRDVVQEADELRLDSLLAFDHLDEMIDSRPAGSF
jgi:hypothetical protein